MSIVKSYSKQTNTTYFYEQNYRWNPETKRPEGTRKLIGKLDPETGTMVPTGKRGRPKRETSVPPEEKKNEAVGNPYEAEINRLKAKNKELTDEITALKKALRESEKKVSSVIKIVNSWDE